ncbi:hypothetical protein [Streptomyces sp. NPDC052107]|uniref:hypothetical protein n=1 Tax=Streptomyces sp. NPDC052107 TaxID=3155632 RepID=UPI00343D8E30
MPAQAGADQRRHIAAGLVPEESDAVPNAAIAANSCFRLRKSLAATRLTWCTYPETAAGRAAESVTSP